MQLDEIKTLLKSAGSIKFTKHFHYEKAPLRGLTEKEIEKYIREPANILAFEDQSSPEGHKFALLFNKSSKYDLKIVISLKGKELNVITAHIQNIKRRKVYQKWLKKQR